MSIQVVYVGNVNVYVNGRDLQRGLELQDSHGKAKLVLTNPDSSEGLELSFEDQTSFLAFADGIAALKKRITSGT